MKLKIVLHDKKGKHHAEIERNFPDIETRSDASQKLPHYIICHCMRYYGFNTYTNDGTFYFREKQICV
jgi:hypothetical protein